MISRRRFLALSAAAAAAAATRARAQQAPEPQAFNQRAAMLPLIVVPQATPTPTATATPTGTPVASPTPTATPSVTPAPGDAPILGAASGTVAEALAWLAPRADASYTDFDLQSIAEAYQSAGNAVGIDWFIALAQMAHETGSLTSFWSLRPQRNPAGIGVTGEWSATQPADTTNWAYNTQRQRWERGVSFATWADNAVPAHLGRLLAYALTDAQANQAQRDMIAYALSVRGLAAASRGAATTWVGLNGRWAVPGTTYGQTILSLAQQIRNAA